MNLLAIALAVLRPLTRRQRHVLAAERARHNHAARYGEYVAIATPEERAARYRERGTR